MITYNRYTSHFDDISAYMLICKMTSPSVKLQSTRYRFKRGTTHSRGSWPQQYYIRISQSLQLRLSILRAHFVHSFPLADVRRESGDMSTVLLSIAALSNLSISTHTFAESWTQFSAQPRSPSIQVLLLCILEIAFNKFEERGMWARMYWSIQYYSSSTNYFIKEWPYTKTPWYAR